MNNEIRQCKDHFKPIIQRNDNGVNQCLICLENQQSNKMLSPQESMNKHQEIIENPQRNKDEILKLQQDIDQRKQQKDLTNSFNQRNHEHQLQNIQSNNELNNKYRKFKYQLIKQYPKMEYCLSFAFNQFLTILFLGQGDEIKVYDFNNGEIKNEVQTLSKHTNSIHCLIFMDKSQLIVTGSHDSLIVIWNQDSQGSWKQQQILEGHSNWVWCMVNNQDEDLLISGSRDRNIKFWRKQNMIWSCEQTIQTKFDIMNLSLCKSQTKLISCGYGSSKVIFVMEQQPQNQWIISQKIEVNTDGQQLCFISDNQFVYQGEIDYLDIYNYDLGKKLFVKEKQVTVQEYDGYYQIFPCKYIESKNILIIKNGSYINCFGIDSNSNYILQQSIKYDGYSFGNISNNGQFLIMWESNSDTIQVLELQYLE